MDPKALDLIPENKFYDMTTLFDNMILGKDKVISFPLKEYWLDIGSHSDFYKAQAEVDLWI